MNKKLLFIIWGGLFVICAALGFVSQPGMALKILMHLLSFGFFGLGGWILWQAKEQEDTDALMLIRALSAASLVMSMMLLVINFLSVFSTLWVGNLLHHMLVIVSAPMFCAPSWATSLFLWACLMVVSHNILTKKHK